MIPGAYLDGNATARLLPQARDAVARLLETLAQGEGANPSSIHAAGRLSRKIITKARNTILQATLNGAEDRVNAKLFFTSGGTESVATMLYGFLGVPVSSPPGMRIVTSSIEHECALQVVARFPSYEIIQLAPDQASGAVQVADVVNAVLANDRGRGTALVSIMAANNVTGAIQPVLEIAAELRRAGYGGPIVCDACQAFLKCDLKLGALLAEGVDAIALSGHKIGALSGVGALLLASPSSARQTKHVQIKQGQLEQCRLFEPLFVGGAQEERFRAGSENLTGIASFAAAVSEIVPEPGVGENRYLARMSKLRVELASALESKVLGLRLVTPLANSLGNTLCAQILGIRGDDLVAALDLEGIACSTGSACSSGRQSVSHVPLAMGYGEREAREMVRFSLDWQSSEQEISYAAMTIAEVINRMRS